MHPRNIHFHPPDTIDKGVEGGIWSKIFKNLSMLVHFKTLTFKIYLNQSSGGACRQAEALEKFVNPPKRCGWASIREWASNRQNTIAGNLLVNISLPW